MHPFFPVLLALILIPALGITGCAAGQSGSSTGVTPAEALSYDGLTPLQNTMMSRVWVRKGIALSGYGKVLLAGAEIRYRPVQPTSPTGPGNAALEFSVSPAQKAELEQLISEEFGRALERLTLPTVTEPGPDVLLVRGYMLDVVSEVPADSADRHSYLIDSVGQTTFVVELVDSLTSTVLVRALDTRSARTPGDNDRSNSATNRAQVRQLIARWADLLVDALNDLTTIDALQGT